MPLDQILAALCVQMKVGRGSLSHLVVVDAMPDAAWVAGATLGGVCSVVMNAVSDVVTFVPEICAATMLSEDTVTCALVILVRNHLVVKHGPGYRAAVLDPEHVAQFELWMGQSRSGHSVP